MCASCSSRASSFTAMTLFACNFTTKIVCRSPPRHVAPASTCRRYQQSPLLRAPPRRAITAAILPNRSAAPKRMPCSCKLMHAEPNCPSVSLPHPIFCRSHLLRRQQLLCHPAIVCSSQPGMTVSAARFTLPCTAARKVRGSRPRAYGGYTPEYGPVRPRWTGRGYTDGLGFMCKPLLLL